MNTLKKIYFLSLLFLMILGKAQTNLYVDARKGSDTNTGTTWTAAYKTLDRALQQVRTPATGVFNIYIAAGSYTINDTHTIGANAKVSVLGGFPSGGGTADTKAFPVYITQTYNGSMFETVDNGAELLLKDLTILYSQGSVIRSGIVFFDRSTNNVFTMDHVYVKDYTAGDVGMIYPYNATNVKINILNSIVENTTRGRGGSFILNASISSSANIDVQVKNSAFRNIKMRWNPALARYQSIIEMDMACGTDNGQSEVEIDNSTFYYIDGVRVNRASGGRAPVVDATSLGKLTITNSRFKGNDGQAGVVAFRKSGELLSQNNIFQNNTGAYSGGAYQIIDNYSCGSNAAAVNALPLRFINDQYYNNKAGIQDLIGGRGGAIYLAAGEAGDTGTSRTLQIENSKFVKNYTGTFGGGAVYATTSAAVNVENSEFTCNTAGILNSLPRIDLGGGAMEVKGTGKLNINNSRFYRNISEGYGGAIASNLAMSITGSTFQSNESYAAGGAIRNLDTNAQTINNSFFYYNKGSQGGAIANGTGVLPLGTMTVSGSVFYGNISTDGGKEDGGGAVYNNSYNFTSSGNKYYLNTTSGSGGAIFQAFQAYAATLNVAGDLYYQNKAVNQHGGAIYFSGIGAGNFDLSGSTFYQNQADKGGAISMDAGVNGTVRLDSSDFLQNAATTEGGALAVYDAGQIGDEVDQMDGSKFYGNTVAGSATNTTQDGRSDIYIGNVTNLYYSNIRNITNTQLQFGNNTDIYDTTLAKVGFHLGANVTQSTATSIAAPAAMAAPAQVVECALVPQPYYPIIPQVLSGKDGTDGAFNSYTEIAPDVLNCTFSNAFIKFNAWTTQPDPFTTTPLPSAVTFTYTVLEVDKVNNAVKDLGSRTADATAVLVRDEYAAESGDAYRHQYLTYYVNVTPLLKPNMEYQFIVTNVKDNNTGISTSYALTDGVQATISTLPCSVCYNPVTNTSPGLPVKHGITLLKRAGVQNGNWPMNRNSAHTALESNTKGFVITRVPTSGLSSIANPVEGMMVYDTTEKCLKIYVVDNTTPANTGWKCFSKPTCP
ncbi:hypothetical protein ACF3N7_04590 [Cruoricaptor ignavus]|uniref:hypothetical protein n=1 Tax=Cruoricaptor ignavus TaxID=1118202 RepID=UPI00370D2574